MFEYIVFINNYSKKLVNIYLEKLMKNTIFWIYCLNKRFFCKTVYTIKFVVKKHYSHKFIQKRYLQLLISEVFDKIYFALPTLRIVFTLSTSAIADKKVRVEYFFKNYIHAKFYQNWRFQFRYVPLLVIREHLLLLMFEPLLSLSIGAWHKSLDLFRSTNI